MQGWSPSSRLPTEPRYNSDCCRSRCWPPRPPASRPLAGRWRPRPGGRCHSRSRARTLPRHTRGISTLNIVIVSFNNICLPSHQYHQDHGYCHLTEWINFICVHVGDLSELKPTLTGLLKSSCDVEAALDPDRTDPDEGVGRGLVESIVLRAGVIVSLVTGLQTVAAVHIIVGADLEQDSHPHSSHIPPYLPWGTHRRCTLTVHQPEILTVQG